MKSVRSSTRKAPSASPVSWFIASKPMVNGEQHTFEFPSTITKAYALVSGFDLRYSSDNHVRKIVVSATVTSLKDGTASVSATCEMIDDSNNKASGAMNVVVIGINEPSDVAPTAAGSRRKGPRVIKKQL